MPEWFPVLETGMPESVRGLHFAQGTRRARTSMPGAATWRPWKCVSSSAARSSMGIRVPSGMLGSSVCVGAAM